MRILCLTPWYPAFSGDKEGSFIQDSLEALADLGHDVDVIVTRPWRPERPPLLKSALPCSAGRAKVRLIRHLSIPRNYLRWISDWLYRWAVSARLAEHARTMAAEAILVHTELPAIAAVPVARRLGIPVLVTLHGINTDLRLNTPARITVLRQALSMADRVILVGKPLHEHFASIVSCSEHFRIVPNGFRPPQTVPEWRTRWGAERRFVSVSNLHEGKGIEFTLKALERLKAQGCEQWQYTVVGGGQLREKLERLSAELGIGPQVSFVGPVSPEKVHEHLGKADVFVLPSYREAFGIAYLEAMSNGLLTIGISGQGPSDFIEHGVTGILVAPQDVNDLVEKLKNCFTRPDEMQAIARQGQDRAFAEFTWASHAHKLSEVILETVNKLQ